MSVTCVDTSVLAAIAFDEPGTTALAGRLDKFTRLVSSNLLEAELRAAPRNEPPSCLRDTYGSESRSGRRPQPVQTVRTTRNATPPPTDEMSQSTSPILALSTATSVLSLATSALVARVS